MRPLRRELFGSAAFGLAVVAVFVVGGVAWSMRAPLSGAVIADGVVAFDSMRKTVQHLEGGIIGEILVREGDKVAAGATLIVLEDTAARAEAEELLGRIRALAGEEARLRAERARQPAIVFDHPFLKDAGDPGVAAVRSQQKSLFVARAENLKTRKDILLKRVDQLGRQEEGLRQQLSGVRARLRLVRKEAEGVADLVEQGYARLPRLLAIRRAEAELVATEGELIAAIARNEEAIGETLLRVVGLESELMAEVETKLAAVRAERVAVEALYREALGRLGRTRVVSPVDGIVLNLRFATIGGVIRPGEPILDIAPARDDLIVTARIRPADIDEVAAGAAASVVFPAYRRRYLKRIDGRVLRVSAAAFADDGAGTGYYTAAVSVDRAHLARTAPGIALAAGMPAEVYISTGESTLYDFLMEPVRRTFARALREP